MECRTEAAFIHIKKRVVVYYDANGSRHQTHEMLATCRTQNANFTCNHRTRAHTTDRLVVRVCARRFKNCPFPIFTVMSFIKNFPKRNYIHYVVYFHLPKHTIRHRITLIGQKGVFFSLLQHSYFLLKLYRCPLCNFVCVFFYNAFRHFVAGMFWFIFQCYTNHGKYTSLHHCVTLSHIYTRVNGFGFTFCVFTTIQSFYYVV